MIRGKSAAILGTLPTGLRARFPGEGRAGPPAVAIRERFLGERERGSSRYGLEETRPGRDTALSPAYPKMDTPADGVRGNGQYLVLGFEQPAKRGLSVPMQLLMRIRATCDQS